MKIKVLKNVLLTIIFVLTTTILLYPYGNKEPSEKIEKVRPKYGGIYRKPLEHDPSTLDPALITDIYERVVTQQIFEGLVQYSNNLMVIPCIAESWESSRDNLKWTFYIKKGVKFHNGREVTAKDFIYSFKRIIDLASKSQAASILLRIKGAKAYKEGKSSTISGLQAKGKYQLIITLSQPFPPFVSALAMVNFGVVPEEEVKKYGKEFGKHPVGTGPFVFKSWIHNKEIVLTVNNNYHGGRAYLDGIVFKIFKGCSIEDMFKAFEQGEIEDSLFPVSEKERILKENRYQLIRRPSLNIRMLIMNNKMFPFNNKKVRQAINYAINKKELSQKVAKDRVIPAVGFLPPGMAGYRPDDINYPYNPEKARKLLIEAGFPGGKGLPELKIWSSVKSKALVLEDKLIKSYLEKIGLKVSLNYETNWPKFKKMFMDGKLPIFKYSWSADIPDPDNILSSLFYSKSPTNRAFYYNQEVDKLIQKAQKERDYKKRISMYSEIQDMIMEDAPVILLNYLAYERVYQPYVRNYHGNALGDYNFPLKNIWLDK